MDQFKSYSSEDKIIIDVKELLWKLVEQWKALLVFVIAATLIFLSATYASSNVPASADTEPIVLTPEEQLNRLDNVSRNKVLSAVRTNETINELNAYIAEAPLMQIDSGNSSGIVMLWNVSADESILDDVLNAYRSETFRYSVAESLAASMDDTYRPDGLAELIVTDSDTERPTSNIINMVVYLTDDMDGESVKEAVTEGVQRTCNEMNSGIGSHSVSLISSEVKSVSGSYIAKKQTDINTGLNNLYAQRKNALDNLNTGQKSVYNNIINNASITVDDTPNTPFFTMRRAALGIILGFVLYIIALTIKTIITGRVQSSSNVEDLFGVIKIGEYYPKRNKSLFDSMFCDYGVVSRRHRNHTEIQKSTGEAAETLLALSKRFNSNDILLVTSSRASDVSDDFKDAIKSELISSGINVSEADVDVRNGIAISESEVMKHDAVAIIIDKKKSTLKDVKDVRNKCGYCDIPLIGGIYVG